jgi:aminoglycoside phosphotransferase (APT) family kinase protein
MMDASPEQRKHLQDASVSLLARLHTITPADHDLAFLAQPEHGSSPLDQQLGYQRWYYDWAREGLTYPLIERTFAWLDEHRPSEGPTVLNWGDSRIGNVLYRDFEPVAVLDWEMATIGPAEMDLGWYLVLDDLTTHYTKRRVAGFLEPDAFVAAYERALGRDVTNLAWYEIFALTRSIAINERQARLAALTGVDYPGVAGEGNPVLRQITRRIDAYPGP